MTSVATMATVATLTLVAMVHMVAVVALVVIVTIVHRRCRPSTWLGGGLSSPASSGQLSYLANRYQSIPLACKISTLSAPLSLDVYA